MPEENKFPIGEIPLGEQEEKLEFLKREEIKTMQKDIARLREIEAEKERERIAAIKTQAEKKKEEIKLFPPAEPTGEISIPKPPPRPHPSKKLLIRIGFFLIAIFLFGFFWWFFAQKPTEEVLPPKEEIPPKEEVVEKPEIPPPVPLFSVEKTISFELSKNEEIPEVFSRALKEELPEAGFTQIVIKNITENRLVSSEEIFYPVFQFEAPEGIFEKLEENFTLTIFSQKEGKREALAVKVKEKEGLLQLLKDWEAKIKTEGVFVSGEKMPVLVPYFRTAFYQNVGFRYLTISQADLGICYAWFDDYFVLTTSFESMKKIIERLKTQLSPVLKEKIGQLFIVGFEGKNLTPQLAGFFKKYKPGGVLLLSKNIENQEQLKNLISGLQTLSLEETGLPLFIAVDQEGGLISRIGFLEEKTPQSEIKNNDEAEQIGLKRGKELKELGVNLNLAPVLDFAEEGDFLFGRSFHPVRNPISNGVQKNPEEIGELAKALISGQKATGILTAVKHFPGYVGLSANPEEELAVLEKVPEISQFKKTAEAEPELVMTSNVIYKEIDTSLPFTFSQKGIQFLKNNLGPEILIISDDLAQNSLLEKFSLKEITTKPLLAGVDILIFSGYRLPVEQGLEAFFTAVSNKEISETKINEAISKIIQFKQKLLK